MVENVMWAKIIRNGGLTTFLLTVFACFDSVHAAIDRQTLDNLRYFSQYASAAYCDANTNPQLISKGQRIECKLGDSCSEIEAGGAEYLSSIYNQGLFSLTSLLSYDPGRDVLVLSFRGAENLGVLTQIPMTLAPCTIFCPTCSCWEGFYDAWLEMRGEVVRQLAVAKETRPGRPLVVTGHSLGAILSVYAAGELRANSTAGSNSSSSSDSSGHGVFFQAGDVSMYTYGQPRSGNEDLAAVLSQQQGLNFRVTHTDDPAPRMGDLALGFRHLSPEYWINPDGNLTTYEVGEDDITLVEGYDNLTGNGGTGGYDIPAHVQYFQPQVGACYENLTRLSGLPYSLGGTEGGITRNTSLILGGEK